MEIVNINYISYATNHSFAFPLWNTHPLLLAHKLNNQKASVVKKRIQKSIALDKVWQKAN